MTNVVRGVYRVWVLILFLAVVVQFGAAGYGAFYTDTKVSNDATNSASQAQFDHGFTFHVVFGYLIFLFSLLLLLFALAARLGRGRVLLALALPLLVFLQIVLARIGDGTPAVGVFHPVNGLVIAGISGYLAHNAWRSR